MRQKINEEYITSAEVKKLLNDIADERSEQEGELPYELRRSLEHVNETALLEGEEAKNLVNELKKLDKMDDFVAYKIAEILPETREELRAIYAKERYSLDGDELDEITDIILDYKY